MIQLDSLSALSAIVRAQLSAARQLADPTKTAAKSSGNQGGRLRPPSQDDDSDSALQSEAQLMSRIRSIRPDDEERQKKVFRMFLESVIADEFGPTVSETASFEHIIDRVLAHMYADADLRDASDTAAEVLLARAGLQGSK